MSYKGNCKGSGYGIRKAQRIHARRSSRAKKIDESLKAPLAGSFERWKLASIMYFNLKDGVSEEEFVEKSKEFFDSSKVEGFGSSKLYRHHLFGANRRTHQMHMEFNDFAAWDRFLAFLAKDAKSARLLQEWHNLMDYKTHYDEFIREIPL